MGVIGLAQITNFDEAYLKNQKWLIDNCEDGVYVSDPDTYEILYLNRVGRQLLDLDDDADIHGMKCYEIMQHLDSPCSFCTNQLLKENHYYAWEYHNPVFKRHTLLRDCLISWNGKLCRLEIVLNITTAEQKAQAISRKINIENTLLDCIDTIVTSSTADAKRAIIPILATIGAFYHADRAYILGFQRERRVLSVSHEWARDGVFRDEIGYAINIGQSKRFTEAFENRHPYLIRDIEDLRISDALDYDRQKQRGVRCSYGVPLIVDQKVRAYLCVDNPELNVGNYTLLKSLAAFVTNRLYQLEMAEQQEYELYHDTMTGLLNRNGYALQNKKLEEGGLASLGVVYTNINRLGQINTELGMGYGDRLLNRVVHQLKRIFGDALLVRIGGDEIIAICKNLPYERFIGYLERILPNLDGITPFGVAVGHVWQEDEPDVNQMVYQASQNMIINKRHYMERFSKNSKYSNIKVLEKLQRDIQAGRFLAYLQPKIDIRTEQLKGMEALVRYKNAEGEILTPGKFIPALEREGLIRHIDFFMLEQVCRILTSWRTKGYTCYPVSVNFSRVTIMESGVVDEITAIVDMYKVPHEYILIEITESAGEMGRENFVAIGTLLRNHGFGVSLDDFCSQYSCVSLLPALPFAEVKFDRSMISHINCDEKLKFLCESMMDASNKLHCPVLAEGVETKEQLELLKHFKCDTVQGYYYSPPIPVEELEQKYYS
jgi:EAL domain-containing protein (putative c-di-GMP-specific phosphodiesterase class I)